MDWPRYQDRHLIKTDGLYLTFVMKNGIALSDRNSLELFREWSEKRPCNDLVLGSTVKYLAKQAVLQNLVMEF